MRTPKLPWEAVAEFTGDDERLDHFCAFKVSIELAQLVEPECVATRIRIAPEVAEVFHHHKRFVELRIHETIVLSNTPQCGRAG